ncbi:MAG: hypothetical protein ACHQF0_11535 [Chitinophagales bacterium]
MKNIYPALLFIACLTGGAVMAQSKNTQGAGPLVEKGSNGDLIIGSKIKKDQFKAAPQVLEQPGPAREKSLH